MLRNIIINMNKLLIHPLRSQFMELQRAVLMRQAQKGQI